MLLCRRWILWTRRRNPWTPQGNISAGRRNMLVSAKYFERFRGILVDSAAHDWSPRHLPLRWFSAFQEVVYTKIIKYNYDKLGLSKTGTFILEISDLTFITCYPSMRAKRNKHVILVLFHSRQTMTAVTYMTRVLVRRIELVFLALADVFVQNIWNTFY